ncbi:MAG TPA: TRAP transporter small permease [Burkholderiaceae bacterium]|nr:TRAP transporter small permease [Burkholderiaceae bacterium]
MSAVRLALAAVDRAVESLVAGILAAMVLVGALQVFHRFALNSSLSWSEEAQVFGHIWIVFLGIPVAYRRGAHLFIESLRDLYPRWLRAAFDLGVELLWLAFAVSLVVLGWQVARVAALQDSPGLEIPMSWPYAAMIAGGAYLALLAAERIAGWCLRAMHG